MVNRNAPCPCGSGKKYKHCCLRTAGQAKPDDVVYVPQIAPKLRDLDRRQAEWWRPLPGERVACDLCYRACEIDPGQAGWCRIRRNEDGHLVSDAHGVLASMRKQQRGYGEDPFLMYKPGERSVFVGLTYCTAGCSFCGSGIMTWRPESVPWAEGEKYGAERILPDNSWWYGRRARYTPEQVVDNALRAGARHIHFGTNEPTLTWEFTYDVARLAKARGLDMLIDTNGFTSPAAIRALAPFVDVVHLGIKGSADPAFYERYMHSPGAVPHVLEAAQVWRACDVRLQISDLIAPPHMQDDQVAIEAQERLYGWIVQELGEMQPVVFAPMMVPMRLTADEDWRENRFLLAGGGDEDQKRSYLDKVRMAYLIARAAGLRYANVKSGEIVIDCHNCDAALLRFKSPMLHCAPCTLDQHFCPFWTHEEHVTEDGRCEACGVQTPVVVMPAEDRRRFLHWRATTRPGESVRTKVHEPL